MRRTDPLISWLAAPMALLLGGCVVPLVDFNAEVSRVRALEHDRELAETEVEELTMHLSQNVVRIGLGYPSGLAFQGGPDDPREPFRRAFDELPPGGGIPVDAGSNQFFFGWHGHKL